MANDHDDLITVLMSVERYLWTVEKTLDGIAHRYAAFRFAPDWKAMQTETRQMRHRIQDAKAHAERRE